LTSPDLAALLDIEPCDSSDADDLAVLRDLLSTWIGRGVRVSAG
jgi:hypothetical protein